MPRLREFSWSWLNLSLGAVGMLTLSSCSLKVNLDDAASLTSASPSNTATPSPTGTPTPSPTPTPTATPTPTPVPGLVQNYSLSNTWTQLQLTVTLSVAGTTHWAAFSSDAGTLTAAQVKALVGNCTSNCVSAASFAISAANTATNALMSLADNQFYTVYAVSESGGTLDLDANVKKYTMVIPKKISMQSFTSARSTLPLIRHWLYYPPGYYNSTATFPMLMYIHGGGETPNSAGNAESLFTSGSYRMDKVPFIPRIYQGTEIPFVIASPQCNLAFFACTNGSDSAFYDEVATRVKSIARINLKKVYVYGMSWGGAGTWGYTYDYPEKVTAAVPMSGGLMYRSTASLCTKFVPNNVSLWSTVTVNDPYFSASTISGGTYAGTATGVFQACPGRADARFTEFPGNYYPATVNTHYTVEFFLAVPFYYYSGNGWYYSNSGTNTLFGALPTIPDASKNIPLGPEMVAELAAASTAYGVTINNIYEWMALQSKP